MWNGSAMMMGGNQDKLLRSLRRRATATRFMLGLHIVLNVILLTIGSMILYGWIRHGATASRIFPTRALGLGLGLASLAMLLSVIPLTIAFLSWLHRARSNLQSFHLDGMVYSPAWSVGSFFVPFANLVVPFRSVRELYNRSHGEDVYQSLATVPDVSSWWTSLIAGVTIQLLLFAMSVFTALTNAYFTTPIAATAGLNLLGVALLALSAFFLFRVVGAVTLAQQSTTGVSEAFA